MLLHSSGPGTNFRPLFNLAQYPADLVTFTEETLNGKLHFLCSVRWPTFLLPEVKHSPEKGRQKCFENCPFRKTSEIWKDFAKKAKTHI